MKPIGRPVLELPIESAGAPGAERGAIVVDRWRIDPRARTMTDGLAERRLSPRAVRALELLVEAEGDVVDRATLSARVWPDVIVSDESVTQVVSELRRAFDDRQRPARIIETVSKSGYRLLVQATREHGADWRPRRMVDAFDLDAYGLVLEARDHQSRCGMNALAVSEALAREAAERAPNFAIAQSAFSVSLVLRHLCWSDGEDRLDEALSRARIALALRPDMAEAHIALAHALSAMGRWAEARTAVAAALANGCNDPDSYHLAARNLFAAQDFRLAALLGERAGAVDPTDFKGLFLAARAAEVFDPERARRNAAEALRRVRTRLSVDPHECRARHAEAALLAMLGATEAAYEAIRTIEPRGGPQEYYSAITLAVIGDIDGAVEALERVVDLGWRYGAWLNAEPHIERIRTHGRFGRLAGALRAA